MSLDLTPAPDRDQKLSAMVASQVRFDVRQVLRNGENVLLTILIPLGVLAGLWWTNRANAWATALAIAVTATAFTSQAINTGFDRRYSVLLLLGLSPLGVRGLLISRALVSGVLVALQWLLLTVGAAALSIAPSAATLAASVPIVVLAVLTFTGWALAMAGGLRAEATLALANAVFMLLAAAVAVASIAGTGWLFWVPSVALFNSLLDPTDLLAILLLVAWAVAGIVLALRTFRWQP